MSKVDDVLSFLDRIVPNAHCELTYNSDYGFLISVMLSAQTTDKKVNSVTRTSTTTGRFETDRTLEERAYILLGLK